MTMLLKRLALALLLLPSMLAALNFQLLDEDGTPNETLLTLKNELTSLGLLPENSATTTHAINQLFQKHLLRKNGIERWDVEDLTLNKDAQDHLTRLVKQLPCYKPSPQIDPITVDYIFVYGAKFSTAYTRVKEVVRLLDEGIVTAHQVVLLTGNRLLTQSESLQYAERLGLSPSELHLDTEADMLKQLWLQESDYPCICVNARTTGRRPNTADTLEECKAILPHEGPCTICIPLETPYAHRMARQTIAILERDAIEFIPHIYAGQPLRDAVLLDELARLLYTESRCR